MSRLWVTPEELEEDARSPYAYEACKMASFILWAYSGRKYTGVRTITEHYEVPCRPRGRLSYLTQPSLFPIEPYLADIGSTIESLGDLDAQDPSVFITDAGPFSAGSGDACGCFGTVRGQHVRLRLRGHPVRSVHKVVVGGTEVDKGDYQVVNSSMLQAAPGRSLNLRAGVEVTYTYGTPPPTAGRRAARLLANELSKGWSGEDCMLPDRVTSVTRQGVSITVLDKQDFLEKTRTGIYEVDLFLRAVNPDKARKPARVFSPDVPRATRVTSNVTAPIGPYDLVIIPGQSYTWRQPINEIGAGALLDADWVPQGQISTWNGATLLEFESGRFQVANGTVSMTLTASEASRLSTSGSGVWDLYALNQVDGYSVIHIMTSNVQVSGQSAPTIV